MGDIIKGALEVERQIEVFTALGDAGEDCLEQEESVLLRETAPEANHGVAGIGNCP